MIKEVKNNRESGQAMMELTIMLLILSGMILAVVMISGIEISSNNMLLSARNNAQAAARGTDPRSSEKESEYGNWKYTELDLTKDAHGVSHGSFGGSVTLLKDGGKSYQLTSRGGVLQIPFSYQSESSTNGGVNTLDDVTGKMTSSQYTRPQLTLYERYSRWKGLQEFDSSFQHDFAETVRAGNAFNAARMVHAVGDGSNGAATINHKHQRGRSSADNAASVMYSTFNRIFGVSISNIKMKDHPTNTVYLPVF